MLPDTDYIHPESNFSVPTDTTTNMPTKQGDLSPKFIIFTIIFVIIVFIITITSFLNL